MKICTWPFFSSMKLHENIQKWVYFKFLLSVGEIQKLANFNLKIHYVAEETQIQFFYSWYMP